MLTTRARVVFWIVAIFSVGLAMGVAGSILLLRSPDVGQRIERRSGESREERTPEEVVERLNDDAKLDLTADQKQKVIEIMREARRRYRDENERSRAIFHSIREQSRESIREVLKPEQMEHFDQFLSERRKKHRDESEDRPPDGEQSKPEK